MHEVLNKKKSTALVQPTAIPPTALSQKEEGDPSEPQGKDLSMTGHGSSLAPIQRKENNKGFAVQAKLKIGASDDAYEREADALAEKVVTGMATTPADDSSRPMVQNYTEQGVQGKGQTQAADHIGSQLQKTKGGGRQLDHPIRQKMETGFGTDFSKVKIHTDESAVQLNQQLGAKAFAHGQDIYFNQNNFNAHTTSGQKLLAHELTHVVQQNGGQERIQKMDAFQYTIEISDSVGDGGTNRADDVLAVIDRLEALGFLTAANATAERPSQAQLNAAPLPNIADASLPLTIAAIESFQGTVVGSNNPDGTIDRHGASHQYLNTATAQPSAADLVAIDAARQGVGINTVDGSQELGGGLTSTVGDVNNGNVPADLLAVQNRLLELQLLSAADAAAEAPAALILAHPATYANPPIHIQAAHIPETIEAIVNFQNPRHRRNNPRGKDVAWWAAGNLLGTNVWTARQIVNDDATHVLMRDYRVHSFTFADPNNQGQNINSSFYGPVRSGHTVSAEGMTTTGTANPNLPAAEYTAYGLTNAQGVALRWVEHAEGHFDALNSYDRAIISMGFIQFAGLRSLEKILALIKNDSPVIFQDLFQSKGIDVEYRERNGEVHSATISVIDTGTGAILRGQDALEAIRASPEMSSAFVQAGHYIEVQRSQIELATVMYAQPAVDVTFDRDIEVIQALAADQVTVDQTHIDNEVAAYQQTPDFNARSAAGQIQASTIASDAQALSAVMRSEKGLAALISCYINLPGRVAEVFSDAIITEAKAQDATTWNAVRALSDTNIIAHALAHARMPGTWAHRLNEITADATLSANK